MSSLSFPGVIQLGLLFVGLIVLMLAALRFSEGCSGLVFSQPPMRVPSFTLRVLRRGVLAGVFIATVALVGALACLARGAI